MSTSIAVRPVSPAAPYLGGKKRLARRITSIIDGIEHTSYAEPFVGMGGIFLRRTKKPRAEAINDISGDIATFFRVLQEHYPYFLDMMKFRVASRGEFERLRALPPERLTDLQRAARFLYVQRLAFGGMVRGAFGVDAGRPARFNITKLEPMLAEIHDRLADVVIEQLGYQEFIRRYDRPGALFYLDPPYLGGEADYGPGIFARADFQLLAEQLAQIAGMFILSINDTPEIREIFSRFHLLEVETTYTFQNKASGAKRVGELLISNIPIT